MNKTDAIKAFLDEKAPSDLAELYHQGMEVQVNVADDGGDLVEGEYRGKPWRGYTDGLTTWKNFRIPWSAMKEPNYTDSPLKFDLEAHAEAIGMTGWDWESKRSRWIALDFDAIVGHSDAHQKKLTQDELDEIQEKASQIPWVTIRKSTSGSGLHIYVFMHPDSNIEVANHTEHAAIARAIIGQMSALTGCNFSTKVDICGSNMWVWARKYERSEGKGLQLITQGRHIEDSEIPSNWKDHLNVIKGKSRRTVPKRILETGKEDSFIDQCSQRNQVRLDSEHQRLIDYVSSVEHTWWWDPDAYMLVTHTKVLKDAFENMAMRGAFDTISTGSNMFEQNCYCFPIRKGGWIVRRFTPGVSEHPLWDQDSNGWTRIYLNKDVDLSLAARAYGGIEDEKGWFHFTEAESAEQAVVLLGSSLNLDPSVRNRPCRLKAHKDGRLMIEIDRQEMDTADKMPGFLPDKKIWKRVANVKVVNVEEIDTESHDDLIRHVITESHEDAGWVIRTEQNWIREPLVHVNSVLGSLGFSPKDVKGVVGGAISRPWKLVNRPFEDEYPGDRTWNKHGAQLKYTPNDVEDTTHPTWDKVFDHLGKNLTQFVRNNAWCKMAGIVTGGDYLRAWASCMFKYPEQPLPYLFFYNPKQNTGKSTFYDSLSTLMTKGFAPANSAITNTQGFNGELEGAVLCYIEEIDLGKNKMAYDRIKDWVTSKIMSIHRKRDTPYVTRNTTHWVHCANDIAYCPIFKGDTRITMVFVDAIHPMEMIPKLKLDELLKSEAQDFVTSLLRMELPPPNDRLRLPVIETEDKETAESLSLTLVQQFLKEMTRPMDGQIIEFSRLYDKFVTYIGPKEATHWTKTRFGKEMVQEGYPKGRIRGKGHWGFGNIVFEEDAIMKEPGPKLKQVGDYLESQEGGHG